jgi:hypothetical protein
MSRKVPDQPEEVIMATTEDLERSVDTVRDPQTLSIIERIFYFEQFTPIEADNDNATKPGAPRQQASACFDAWAMPDYMRR